jgi:predicted methyltransferase
LDAILMSQILHDFANAGEAAAIALLTSLRTLLKPSGALIVIDHAGESGLDNLRLHRMPVEQAKRVAEAAGYTLQAESSLLANPRDRHRRPVFDPMLARNTDRFLLRFQP